MNAQTFEIKNIIHVISYFLQYHGKRKEQCRMVSSFRPTLYIPKLNPTQNKNPQKHLVTIPEEGKKCPIPVLISVHD